MDARSQIIIEISLHLPGPLWALPLMFPVSKRARLRALPSFLSEGGARGDLLFGKTPALCFPRSQTPDKLLVLWALCMFGNDI